jgi:hypothetical protein
MGGSRLLYLLRGESADASDSGLHRFAALAIEGESRRRSYADPPFGARVPPSILAGHDNITFV